MRAYEHMTAGTVQTRIASIIQHTIQICSETCDWNEI